MSLRSELMQESDTFKYAFLASQAAAILKKSNDASVSDDEAIKIENAHGFIDNLICGAENLSEGSTHGFASYDAIQALSFVLNPIESLRSFVTHEKLTDNDGSRLLTMFRRISAYLNAVRQERRLISGEDKQLACEFFDWWAQTLLETVKQLPSASLPQHPNTKRIY
jgi:hypothetical protein